MEPFLYPGTYYFVDRRTKFFVSVLNGDCDHFYLIWLVMF